MWRPAFAIPFVALLSQLTAFSEITSNFSGTWKSDTARSDSAHQAAPVGPITLIISQTATEISIQTQTEAKYRPLISNERLTFTFDGTETTATGSSGVPIVCKAHWEGAELVVETVRSLSGSTVTTSWRLRLDATGKEMVLKKTLAVQHGYQSREANNVGTGTDIFVKIKAGVKR